MWDEDLETVEDEMYKLVQKSLLRQEWDDDLLCMTFSIHDLQRDFLKQNTENLRVSKKGEFTARFLYITKCPCTIVTPPSYDF